MRWMRDSLAAAGAHELWDENEDTCHLNGTARMGHDPRTSVVNADCRSWDVPNLWICDGSVFPYSWRRQPVADDPGDRVPNCGSDPRSGRQR